MVSLDDTAFFGGDLTVKASPVALPQGHDEELYPFAFSYAVLITQPFQGTSLIPLSI